MLRWISTVFSRFNTGDTDSGEMDGAADRKKSHWENTVTETQKKDNQTTTWVYIWNMTSNGPGHAAIQVGGEKPKFKAEDEGEYISIHPDAFPSVGLTALLPLPAALATTLEEDIEMETLSRLPQGYSSIDDLRPMPVMPSAGSASAKPDHTFKLENLDTEAMTAQIKDIRQSVEEGKTGYQLFPNISLLGFFNSASSFVAQDPIDVEMHRRRLRLDKENSPQVENCTSLVRKILKGGGQSIEPSKMPWGITPDGLAQKISYRAM